MKKTGFNGYVYDFSVDYDATDVDDIKDIHKYMLIASPASPHRKFCFCFHRQLRFRLFTHVSFLLCLNRFHFYVPCLCHCSIPVCSCRLSRAIHQHIFNCLVGAQFTVCMTCLTSQTFLFWFQQTIAFSLVYLF